MEYRQLDRSWDRSTDRDWTDRNTVPPHDQLGTALSRTIEPPLHAQPGTGRKIERNLDALAVMNPPPVGTQETGVRSFRRLDGSPEVRDLRVLDLDDLVGAVRENNQKNAGRHETE
jgi:hypothetical protein